jgi:hypothetical protein
MRDQIPALVEKCIFLSDEARNQVLRNYKTLPEDRISSLVQKLTEGYKKQQEFFKKRNDEQTIKKRKQNKNTLQKLKEDESTSRTQESLELRTLEDEINSLF